MSNRKIGIEVEHPVYNKGKLALACGRYGFNKEEPLIIPAGTIHEDGVMMEFAINPTETADEQIKYYHELMDRAQQGILKKGDNLGLCSGLLYPQMDLLKNPASMDIGCSPSFIAYRVGEDTTPKFYEDDYRYAGVHVNIDFDGTKEEKVSFIKALDYHLGLYSVVNWEQDDKAGNVQRRKAYGQAGNFRFTPFGVEYRSLPSTAWSDNKCRIIYDLVDEALADPLKFANSNFENAINNCNIEEAKNEIAKTT